MPATKTVMAHEVQRVLDGAKTRREAILRKNKYMQAFIKSINPKESIYGIIGRISKEKAIELFDRMFDSVIDGRSILYSIN